MNTIRYLNQVKNLNNRINDMIEDVERLRELATKVSVGEQDPDRVQTSGPSDKVGNIVVKICDMQNDINKRIDEYVDLKETITQQINCFWETDNHYAEILYKRHILFKSFSEMAKEMNYSFDHVKRIYYRAVYAFENRFGKNYLQDDTK